MPIEEHKRVRTPHPAGGELMTKQSEKENCDINVIMDRWQRKGIEPVIGAGLRYGDFSGVGDYHQAMNRIMEAEEQFYTLPAKVREACENDVGKFLDAVQDENERERLIGLGLPADRVPGAAGRPEVPAGAGPEVPADAPEEPVG